MQTVSIEVTDQNDLQLLLLLVNRLGLKIVSTPPKVVEEKKDLAYYKKIVQTNRKMTEERMQEMLQWLEEDRNDESRSNRPS